MLSDKHAITSDRLSGIEEAGKVLVRSISSGYMFVNTRRILSEFASILHLNVPGPDIDIDIVS